MKNLKKIFISCLSLGTLLTCGGFTTYQLAIEKHKVTYELQDGEISSPFVRSVRWIDEVELPTAEKAHCKFNGWNDGITTVSSIKHVSDNITLTAEWTPEVYTVTFMDGNKEISKSNYAYGTGVEDLNIFAEANASNHPYEDFAYWKDEEGNKVESLSETDFGDKVLTASYKGKTYTITYELNGGSAEEGLPETYSYGKGVKKFPSASKNGYLFDGWYSDEGCTKPVESIDKDVHGDLTLYAKYSELPSSATTTRRSNGTSYASTSSSFSSTSSYDTSIGMTIPRLGYHVDNMGTGMVYDAENWGGYEWHTAEYWVNDANGSYYADYIVEGDDTTGIHHTSSSLLWLYDHASQGLSGAGWRMQAGDVVYFNGATYTYSGHYEIADYDVIFSSTHGMINVVKNGYRAVLTTCTEDNSSNYILYLY